MAVEVEWLARGLAAARQRSESPDHLEQTLCSYVAKGRTRPQQRTTLAEAGREAGLSWAASR